VQFQNLPKLTLKDPQKALSIIKQGDADAWEMCYSSPMQSLSACIRGLVVPKPGHFLAVVDYAAIEDRTGMWAAGEEKALKEYEEKKDAYLLLAEAIYQQKGFTKHDNPKERFVGKTARLGLVYGMGSNKFRATCIAYGQDIEAGLAEKAVKTYRSTYRAVPAMWYGMEEAAEKCVLTGKPHAFRDVLFQRERDFLYMMLPSGRRLAYNKPGKDNEGLYYHAEDSQTFTYQKKRTWGGRLFENLNQGIARDIMAEAVLRLEDAGYPVVMTVHDEAVVELEKGREEEINNIIKVMCELPVWAKGCPIGAEGFVCDRYRKG
jgi:DNA polymerase